MSCSVVSAWSSNTLLRLCDSHVLADGLLGTGSPRRNGGTVRGIGSAGRSRRRHKSTVWNILSWFRRNLGAEEKQRKFRWMICKREVADKKKMEGENMKVQGRRRQVLPIALNCSSVLLCSSCCSGAEWKWPSRHWWYTVFNNSNPDILGR